jgi:multidrug efflux pump subunit AcrA (membrane-fusion protein)
MARAGDFVKEGQTIAVLEDRDLKYERLKWEGEVHKIEQRQREALAKSDRAGLLAIAAQMEQAQAELSLVDAQLKRTQILAPIDGFIVSGDLSQMLGSPVEQGKVLFEIAPLKSYRVVMQVPEEDVRFVKVGQTGTLAVAGSGGRKIGFEVTTLTSVSTPQDGRNVFRTEAKLIGDDENLRPGMEGIAKVEIGRASLLWILARRSVEKSRMLIWSMTP